MKHPKLNQCNEDILIIEESPETWRMLVEILQENGYKIKPLPESELSVSSVQQWMPALILLDITIPDIDSYEICSQLKVNERTRNIPVIFISAVNDRLDKVKAFAVGGSDTITKPFQVEEVLARIETHVTLQHLQKKLQDENEYLTKTLQKLTKAQSQLIASEKMAVLGQLMAGVAHEINTPLGAISASIGNISKALENSAQQLPQLCRQLSAEQLVDFFSLSEATRQASEMISFREERKLKRAFRQELEARGIQEADTIAATLVKMGFTQDIAPFIPLLKEKNSSFIVEAAYNLAVQQQNSTNIRLAVEQASKMVLALKFYSHHDPQMIKTQVTEGIDVVLTICRNQLKYGIETSKNYAGVPPIFCHPEELNQVWINLIHNSIQAMNGKGKLEIDVFERDKYVVVRVTDSGCGISPAIKDRIFEPLFTTKEAGEGSGLGLDIVRQIIDKHRGKIEVDSVPGNTTFTVYLPTDESSE